MKNRVVNILKFVAQNGTPVPRGYPDGMSGEFLKNPSTQPLSLLLGAIAMYGSDFPWDLPYELATRLRMDQFDAVTLATKDMEELKSAIGNRPMLHIDPTKMGKWISGTAKVIVGQYGGRTSWIWDDYKHMDVSRLVIRLKEIPGIGIVKALIFAFLLNRDWGADIVGWNEFKIPMDLHMLKVSHRLGITLFPMEDPEQLVMVYEGLRNIMKRYCVLDGPRCEICPLLEKCPRQGV
jgi:endonuclease III